jgi:glucoamylase
MRTQGSVVKNDLEEVAHGWREPSFDLWEEARGSHLWTDAVARRALQAGAGLAARLGDAQAARYYAAQAREVALRTATFAHGAVWNASIPTPEGRNGLDAGALLAFIHAGGRNNTTAGTATSDNLPVSELAATDGATLSTLHAYVLSFDSLYAVNRGRAWVDGWLVGRYSSDIYDGVGFSGGNPWYIATYSVAHVLYAAQAGFARAAAIDFSTAAAFWADLGFAAGAAGAAGVASVAGAADHLGSGAETFRAALRRLGEVADVFVAAAARTIREGTGAMSEQIDRNDGAQRGARDLTWSYAAFLEMKRARDAAKAAVGAVVAVAGLSDKAAE